MFNMGEGGWSEVYYLSATDIAAVIPLATALGNKRNELLSSAAGVVGARIVPLDVDGNATGRGRVLDLRGQLEGVPTGEARDQFTTAIRVTFADTTETRRKFMWMRGLPDSAVAYDPVTGKSQILQAWKDKLTAYTTFLTNEAYQVKYLNPNVNAGDIQFIDRIGFTTEGALRATFKVAPPAAFDTKRRVIIRKYRGELGPRVNGRTMIAARDTPMSLTMNKWATYCADQETMGGGAEMVKEVYGFTPIQVGRPIQISAHKVGRPFFLQVGQARSLRGCPVTLVAPASSGSASATARGFGPSPEPPTPSRSDGTLLAPMP